LRARPGLKKIRAEGDLAEERIKARRVGILISGRGSNMVALADAVREGRLPGAEIAVVLSDKPSAAGRVRARDRGLKRALVERRGLTREEHEREMISALRAHGVEIVCLAGFMRLLSPCFIEEFRGSILNIHPSLLPAFPGLDAQRQAIEHGVKFSGCTVHFVDETLDGGPIITQRVVPVLDSDTPDTLAARILAEEHKAYPEALALVCGGKYKIEGRRVIAARKI
jgi:phosphoribosylglycinamide formyltransferase 1